MMHWLTALICGSLAYALADILCDEVISESDTSSIDTPDDEEPAGPPSVAGFPVSPGTPGYRVLAQETPGGVEPAPAQTAADGLTGTQDAAVSGLVTTAALVLSVAIQLARSPSASALVALKWRPHTHVQFWLACLGGACSFYHNYFLLRAFEHAPSTVLLPLIQVASVSVLFGSSVLALIRGETFITPMHAVAYALMFLGGLLPAVGGQLRTLLSSTFWTQRFVLYAVASEMTLGLHDLLLSGCAYERPRAASASHAAGDGDESFEFIVWSRLAFVATFLAAYLGVSRLRSELLELLSGRVRAKLFGLSILSELLALGGYYLVSLSLANFYQPAIVHAAEASLSQCLNLLLAFALLHGCGIGRQSAVGSMGAKMVSLAMVTVGLVVCAYSDSAPASSTSHGNTTNHGTLHPVAANASMAAMVASAGSAGFYANYPRITLPAVHSLHGGHGQGRPWHRLRFHKRSRKARKAAKARYNWFFPTEESK